MGLHHTIRTGGVTKDIHTSLRKKMLTFWDSWDFWQTSATLVSRQQIQSLCQQWVVLAQRLKAGDLLCWGLFLTFVTDVYFRPPSVVEVRDELWLLVHSNIPQLKRKLSMESSLLSPNAPTLQCVVFYSYKRIKVAAVTDDTKWPWLVSVPNLNLLLTHERAIECLLHME